jgi:hypothetical protein
MSESHARGVVVFGEQVGCRRGECPDVGRAWLGVSHRDR